MRMYNHTHRFYCGVDLHARSMYLCILDHTGQIVLHHEVPADNLSAEAADRSSRRSRVIVFAGLSVANSSMSSSSPNPTSQ